MRLRAVCITMNVLQLFRSREDVNAALRDTFKYQDPYTYSSGGPTWNVLEIWKAAAPDMTSKSHKDGGRNG